METSLLPIDRPRATWVEGSVGRIGDKAGNERQYLSVRIFAGKHLVILIGVPPMMDSLAEHAVRVLGGTAMLQDVRPSLRAAAIRASSSACVNMTVATSR